MTADVTLGAIERHRAYSTAEAAYYLGISSREVAAMAQAGEFGPRGSWPITTTGGRLHAIRIAGWAIDAWISRHQLGRHR